MRDIDKMIDEAIGSQERQLLQQIGEEPGHFGQIAELLTSGPSAWISVALMIAQSVLFIGGCWAGWEFFHASDALAATQWGIPGAVAILSSLIMKMSLWPVMHTNRIMRELKRVELQIALTRKGE